MLPIQILGLIGLLVVIIGTLVYISKRKISPEEGILWLAIWILLLIVVLIPGITFDIARLLGIGRGADLVVYLLVFLLLVVDFYLIARIEQLETNMTRLVREIALRDIKKKPRKKK